MRSCRPTTAMTIVDSSIFIDGTHIKAGSNKKKFRKHKAAQTAKVCAEQLRKTERGRMIYAMRKETIERVFADAKEKHAMRYTHHRGLARVTSWVRLKYAAMNFKKAGSMELEKLYTFSLYCYFLPA